MKVTLIYPGITLDGFCRPGVIPKTGWINHGLSSISAALKRAGHDVSLIDLRAHSGWDDFAETVRRIQPDVAGITVMSLDFDHAIASAGMIRRVSPKTKIVVGGPHPSIAGGEFMGQTDIDHIFKGEAEVTFPKVIQDIKDGKLHDKVITGQAPDLDSIPYTDRTLFKILEAPIVPYLKMPFVTAIAGRGCSYNCSFCQPAERMIFGRKVRRMSAERFVEELRLTEGSSGIGSLMIHDDCLLEDKRWVEDFLRLYRANNMRYPFVCQSRADIIVKNPALFKDMKSAGLAMLLIGFESGSQRVLNFLRKGTKVEDNYKAASICHKLGIRIWANFMLGIPTETDAEARETIRMIKKIRPYVPSPAFYTPHPGSDLFDYCVKNGLSLVTKHEDFRRNPDSPKIKGVDYDYLKKLLSEVKPSLAIKLWRKADRLKLGRYNKELINRYEPGK